MLEKVSGVKGVWCKRCEVKKKKMAGVKVDVWC